MKKMLRRLLCAMLALCLFVPCALADVSVLSLSEEGEYFYIQTMLAVGDTAYIWGSAVDDKRLLYSWKAGEEKLTMVTDALGYCYEGMTEEEFCMMQQDESADFAHAVSTLLTDGERLLAFNIVSKLFFEIVPTDAGVTFKDLVTLQNPELLTHYEEEMDYSYFIEPYDPVVVDNVLVGLLRDYTMESGYQERVRLVRIDLTTGVATESPVENLVSLCAYKDGKVLAAMRDKEHIEQFYDEKNQRYYPLEVAEYDPKTDSMNRIGLFDGNTYRPVWEWSEALQAPVWVDNARINAFMGMSEIKQVGFTPGRWANRICVMDSKLLVAMDSDVYVREMSRDFNAEVYLNTYSTYGEGQLLFASLYPNVPVYANEQWYSSMEGIAQAMVTGSDSLDILGMSVSYSPFEIMLRKGYCADLSGSEAIMEAVGRMHPVFQEAVKNKDGKICAVPLGAYSSGWRVNREVMEAVGLTMEDLPTNYVELCEFVTRWNEEYADEFDMYTVFSTSGSDYVKNNLFDLILTDYINYCQAKGGSIRFDTPVFRELTQAIENMKVDSVHASWENTSEGIWRESLFDSGYTVVGNFSSDDSYSIELPLSLTKDTPVVNTVMLEVVFINPKSKQLDMAMKYVECLLASLDDGTKHILFADETEPVENPYYEEGLKSIQSYTDTLKEELETAEPEMKKELERWIEENEKWLEQYKTYYRYNISEEAIAHYQQVIVPTIAVGKRTFLNADENNANSELSTLIKRYRDKQITIDQFIKEADQKLMMMEMEDQ